LEEAAKRLVGEMEPKKLKTKVRRLYDIANVFKSLGLVKKTSLSNKKPGFEWIGISGLSSMFKAKS
jgi:transcription factor E2F7/8